MYISKGFKEFCDKKGIKGHYTISYTPQENGVAKRFNRTGKDKDTKVAS